MRLATTILRAVLALACVTAVVTAPGVAAEPAADARGLELFTSRLRLLLAHRCAQCHGAGAIEGGLDMSTRDKLLVGGEHGPAIVPGKASESRLYRLAARLEEPHMPEEGDALTREELGWLSEWIDRGAPFDKPLIDNAAAGPWTERVIKPADREHWAFRPLVAVTPPEPADPARWCRTPIDRFILAKLRAAGLETAAAAAPQTLLRRLSLDLTGLPPAPGEVADFCADFGRDPEGAVGRGVDGLLARPAFGERWAQHWLDVARFAESFGYEQDYDRPHAHHYRDFVIRSFNADLPYDTFLEWQIAGDELAPDSLDARAATGFLAAGAFPTQLTEREFESARAGEIDDMVATVGTAMLGVTLGCARCHDHKFDPVPQADYYRLAATFTTTIRGHVDMPVDPAGDRERLAQWEARLAEAVRDRAAHEAALAPRLESFAASWKPDASAPPPAWRLGNIVSAERQGAAGFVSLPDGSLLAAGAVADQEIYTIVLDAAVDEIGAIRLDALADSALPRGGPGRVAHGNFALSNVTVSAAAIPAAGQPAAKAVPVKLVNPRADFSQSPQLDVADAIDANPSSAWAIDPQVGAAHVAAFDFETPVRHPGGVRLTVKLEFRNNARHAIGRPRLAVAATAGGPVEPVTPDRDPLDIERQERARVGELLAIPAAGRTDAWRAELERLQRRCDDTWRRLDREVKLLESAKPAATLEKLLVAGENVARIPHHADGRGYPHFYPETHFLRRGDVSQKEGVAPPGFLQVLSRHPDGPARWQAKAPTGATTSHRRAALARWLTDVDHGAGHVAARVIVNRLWQHHFGTGLVATASDFGRQGEEPSHPELLDWLAGELIRGGWRLKPIHRLLVTSAAYRQGSAAASAAAAGIDPGNRLVGHFNRRRLEGEAIRDTLLAVSGGLDPALYGRAGRDETSPRRSIYLDRKRSQLPAFLRAFDSPDFVSGVARRSVTTTAPQALLMMNSPAVRGWAEQFAKRLTAEASSIPELPPAAGGPAAAGPRATEIRAGFAFAVGRAATAAEAGEAEAFLAAQEAAYRAVGRADAAAAAFADFCQVLLGLNETLHIE